MHIPRMSATQSMGRLPLNPREACHRRSSATPGLYCSSDLAPLVNVAGRLRIDSPCKAIL